MKKFFSLVAVAATFSFAACTGNKAGATAEEAADSTCCEQESCSECPVQNASQTLTAAIEAGNAEEITNALQEIVAKAGELAQEGKEEMVNALVQSVGTILNENQQKLEELGAVEALKALPATLESAAVAAKENAEAAANQAAEDVKDAAAQKVEDAKDAAAEKVDEAATKAAEKVDEAATKAAEKVDEAAAKAASDAKKKLGL